MDGEIRPVGIEFSYPRDGKFTLISTRKLKTAYPVVKPEQVIEAGAQQTYHSNEVQTDYTEF